MSVSDPRSFDFKLPVPHVSQRLSVTRWNEPHRACGMVCVYMALKYYEELGLTREPASDDGKPIPDLDLLIANARDDGGLIPGVGWSHSCLVNTFREFGINCTREEGMDPASWMERFADFIERCRDPVLISTQHMRFGPKDLLTHIVLLTGTRRSCEGGPLEGFFFHDANVYREGEGQHVFVSIDDFPQGWRRMAILPCTKT